MPGTERTEVIVVGGGIVGLSAAALLAWHGVSCVMVERRQAPSPHPRARGLNPRAVEVFRSIGLEPEIVQISRGFADHTVRARVESLTGREYLRADLPGSGDLSGISPSRWALCGQDRVEPVVRRHAERLGADVRFGTELVHFNDDGDVVTAALRSGPDGTCHEVRADYLIGADGAGSGVRTAAGIGFSGVRAMHHQVSILFDADLAKPLRDRRFAICQVHNHVVDGLLVHDDALRQGTLYVRYRPEDGERVEDFDPRCCARLIRAAIGADDLEVRVRDVQPWELSAQTADHYRRGRVFLAGDAAHVMPPVGGFGASTGIQDVHNLAWRIAFARGAYGPSLLDGYEAERAPIGSFTVEQCKRRVITGAGFANPTAGHGLLDDLTLIFGLRYGPDATPLPHPPAGEPGTRLPHTELLRNGVALSSLDLVGRSLTVLAGPDGSAWIHAAGLAGARTGMDLAVHVVGGAAVPDPAGTWSPRCGVGAAGAVLVRPDGIVAWRAGELGTSPTESLEQAVRQVLQPTVPVQAT